MAPQLQINQGPQDALLFDNTRSYFTNVGYVRTSNFQMELRDVDPQNAPNLGGTVNFVIPKASDLLGPVDLMVEFNKVTTAPGSAGAGKHWGWVENVGYAMIEKITFSVGNHDVETLTGDHLNIMNELMRQDHHRYGFEHILKTGRPLAHQEMVGHSGSSQSAKVFLNTDTTHDTHDRLIAYDNVIKDGKKLIIPVGLFFTTHPSKYFPLAAVAGCNEVRISIKFRTKEELLMAHGEYSPKGDADAGVIDGDGGITDCGLSSLAFENGTAFASKGCFLRCHYIHVTGPEATALMSREHVRLMQLWHGNEMKKQFTITCSAAGTPQTLDLDLSFLHPVKELVITIRKVSEMGSSLVNNTAPGLIVDKRAADNTGQTKNYFAYHGGGKDPNPETWHNSVEELGTSETAKPTHLLTTSFNLRLNGQSRHLDGQGIDRDYLMNRLMPMLHSNACEHYGKIAKSSVSGSKDTGGELTRSSDWKALAEMKDRKEIYVFPFALNPEGANPSGSVNFSKVSHAKLSIGVKGFAPSASGTTTVSDDYVVDVYGLYYNWLAIKDGRALISFA